jgi:hypothetical protein
MSVERFKKAQGRISEVTYNQYKNYAYQAGYFQSIAESMFRCLSEQQQEVVLRQVEADAVRLETLAQASN